MEFDFTHLHEEILPAVRRHVAFKLRFSGQQEIENIVQETMLRVIEHYALFTSKPILPWAYRVANNLIVDHYRSHKTEPLPEQDIIRNENAPTERQILIKAAFDEAMRELTEDEQRCLYLDATGKRDAEIAEETGLPLTTVAFRLKTARQKIRDNKKFAGLYSKTGAKHGNH